MKFLEKRKSYFESRRRNRKAFLFFSILLTIFMVFATGCSDNPGIYNPDDPTSCDLHHLEISPSEVSLAIGDTLTFQCKPMTRDNQEILDPIEYCWSCNNSALHIDQFYGFTRLMTELPSDVTLTVKAYDCNGEEYIGTATVRMAGPK